jgi:hypothetical protein
MIINEQNKALIEDVAFSCVRFKGEELPFYVQDVCSLSPYLRAQNFMGSNVEEPYWHSSRMEGAVGMKIHRSLLLYEGDTSMTAVVLSIEDVQGTEVGSLEMLQVNPADDWIIVFKERININIVPANYKVVVKIVTPMTSEIIATTLMQSIVPSDYSKYIMFNFIDVANIPQFPFYLLSEAQKERGVSVMIRGGIQIGNSKLNVNQKSFRDQRYNPHHLNPVTYKTATLTIGGSEGVPEWVGEAINDVLCCGTIFMNGRKIVRSGDSIPEPKVIAKDYPLVNFSMEIEYIETNPNVFDVYTEQL